MSAQSVSVELAKNALDEFSAKYPSRKKSENFELFTAFCVLRKYEVEDVTLEAGCVGEGKDGGIDWIYVIINGRVVSLLDPVDTENITRNSEIRLIIGQAKEEIGWKASVGEKFLATFGDLFGGQEESTVRAYASDLTTSVKNFLEFWFSAAKKRPILIIELVQASLSDREPHDDVKASMALAAAEIDRVFRVQSNQSFLGSEQLFNLYSAAPSYDASLKYVEELEKGDDKVALVTLYDYYKFLCDDQGQLNEHFFEDNVRDYERGVNVNKQILNTLQSEAKNSDFWWLNNGITMLVSEPPVSSRKEYDLRDVQIVNGLQTSQTIYDWARAKEAFTQDNRTVLVRIIAPSNEDEKAKVIRATNSQTPVSKASLRATDEIHKRIEDVLKLRGLFYDRRKNYYKNHGKSPREIISITLLSQAMISAFLMRPDTARARPSSFLDNDDTYNDLFDSGRDMEQFCWAAAAQKRVDEALSSSNYSKSEKNNLRFYVLLIMRVLGSSIVARTGVWSSRPCKDDWFPSNAEILRAADWIVGIQQSISTTTSSPDSVYKGSALKEHLKKDWKNKFKEWTEF